MKKGLNENMKIYEIQSKNVCAQKITFALEDGIIHDVKFHGGCSGNAKGMANLLEGADAREAIRRLENVTCQNRGTSCPAELAKGLKEAIE
ncbi:MAG: TIGR03905 family TSCPD domain-containing protein [Oscillospiraceae bacterium]|nr:TIGR03905 family TSCPD domain-containing protein [Oscillospiraceae bacterium]